MERAIEFSFDKKITRLVMALLYLTILPLTLLLLGCAILFDCFAPRYTYLKGSGPEKTTVNSIATWNVCMLFGGLPIPFGGVTPSSARISDVATEITDYDIVCLQEVSQDASYKLYEKLKHIYHHFYFKINPDSIFSLDSSLFITSKVPLTDIEIITIPQGDRLRRAAFSFRAADTRFTTFHLDPHSADIRTAQAEAILLNRDGIFLGDFNMFPEEFQKSPFNIFQSSSPTEDHIVRATAQLKETSKKISDHKLVYAAKIGS